MNEIIDVEYKEVINLSDKTTEELTAEANTLWNQMEAIGSIGIMMAAQAGRRLNVIKERLPHGEWESWAQNNLKFSLRKANNMMKLAEKTEDENSFFANPQSLADIGITKVWALLSAPEDVAKEVVENPDAAEMTTREFKEEIRRLKEKNAELKKELEDSADESQNLQSDLRTQIDQLVAELKIYEETPAKSEETEKEIADLKTQLEKANTALEKEKKNMEKAKASIEEEKQKAADEAAKTAKEEALAKFKEDNKLLIESNQQAAEEIDRLQRLLENNSQPEIAELKVHSDQLQKSFLSCRDCIGKITDIEKAAKMRMALKTIMQQLIDSLEV